MIIKTPTKGMRDFLPEEMALREYVLNVMKETYKAYGFSLIGTPVVEHIENLTSKQGGENEKLIFKIMKRGEKLNLDNITNENDLVDSGLRYDLTVPLTRLYANNMNELPHPFRALQIGYSYRAERPQRGRYRELMQCDLDILGEKTNLAEIELMMAVTSFLEKLDFKGFKIRINDRRILLKMVSFVGLPEDKLDSILISLDKMDKIGLDGVREELIKLSLDKEKVDAYLNLFSKQDTDLKNFCAQFKMDEEVVSNLHFIMDTVSNNTNATLVFDPTLVRGMGYYTGTIFEIEAEGLSSSIGGGGRYDKMIEKFTNMSVPACGFSIGFERIITILKEKEHNLPIDNCDKVAIVVDKDITKEALCDVFQEAKALREKEHKQVLVVYKTKNFKFQKDKLAEEGYNELIFR